MISEFEVIQHQGGLQVYNSYPDCEAGGKLHYIQDYTQNYGTKED